MASPAEPIAKHWAPPVLSDELLEEIFLRLPTPAALARVSTACASFRRIVADRSFLRRFRAIHPPPLLGFVNDYGFHPAEPPHTSAPLARALADAADFSYSFVLPLPYGVCGPRWRLRDVRDGRVLLECSKFSGEGADISTNLAVCDPVSRRYVLLPCIPEDLTTQQGRPLEFVPFLAPTGDDEEETSFKVMCMAQYKSKLVVFVFSSIAREWCIAASPSWSSLGMAAPSHRAGFSYFDYVHGCFYWAAHWVNKLLVLDWRRMEFSTVDTPPDYQMWCMGAPHIVDKIIPLTGRYVFKPAGSTEGLLFIEGARIDDEDDNPVYIGPLPENWDIDYFSLDVKTSELKKVCKTTLYPNEASHVYPYFVFPPSLSLPSL
ncbi:hypothetical protein ACP70R_004528 [Stipagrostis hirtigluma subsp. patula]